MAEYRHLIDIQIFKGKSYQQKIGGNVEFRIKYDKMKTECSPVF